MEAVASSRSFPSILDYIGTGVRSFSTGGFIGNQTGFLFSKLLIANSHDSNK